MPRKRFLDYDAVKRARTGGVAGQVRMSYAELAKKFGVTESAVYYACNPTKRVRRRTAIGKPHQVYGSDEAWAQLRERAAVAGTTISRVIDAILHGEDPPLVRPTTQVPKQEEEAA